jgi:choline transport protein
MPLNALGLISVIAFLLSLIYIGSSTAFNAIIALTGIALHISYLCPILFFMLKKMKGDVKMGPWSMGCWGIPVNLFSLMYLIFVIIWMPFPTELPVTGSNMNYAGPVFLAILIGALTDWVISGHKRFQVPVSQHLPELD